MDPHYSVTDFIQRFVLRTPQGWAWLASSALLLVLAALALIGAIDLSVGSTPIDQATACVLAPIFTFLLLIKSATYSSLPSWSAAAGIFVVSFSPWLYGYWYQFYD
jgi:hypothetical protein